MKRLYFYFVFCFISRVHAQQTNPPAITIPPRINAYLDFTFAAGNQEGIMAFSYVRNWRLGKSRKMELGLGLRWTSYVGTKREFYPATASLARSSTVPFVNVFAGYEFQNVETLTIQRAFTNSLNLSINAGNRFAQKWYAGLNIDDVGFTFGSNSSATLQTDGNTLTESKAIPSSFNVLLTGDLNYGALNSEFFVKFNIAPPWDIKAVYQFFFTEYNTQTIHRTAPDETEVYRFRNEANLPGLRLSYDL